jgi:hypothetical protein
MWSLYLGIVFCAVSFLPAYFDHGERRKAFKAAKGKEKWASGMKLILLNWGLPILAFSITVAQGLESKATDRDLHKIDPRKQKIEDVSARVWFSTPETNLVEWPEKKDKIAVSLIQLMWGTTNLCRVRLEADNFKRAFINGSQRYYLDFHKDYVSWPMNLHGSLVENADSWDAIHFFVDFLPWNSEILDGEVIITVNNSSFRKFTIPPQRPSMPVITARIHNGMVSAFDVGQGGTSGPAIKPVQKEWR